LSPLKPFTNSLQTFEQDDDPLRSNHAPRQREEEDETEGRDGRPGTSGPDSSHLVRRGALVPGKIVDEGEEQDEVSNAGGNPEQ
jgi:hypothetical protein